MAKKKIRSILSDPRYRDFVKRYRYDWIRFAVEVIDLKPSFQQREILTSVQEEGSRTSVSSGHGTGKSHMTAAMLIAYMVLFPGSRVIIVANNERQTRIGVWKYLKICWIELTQRFGWLQQYFILTDTTFYAREAKGVWEAGAKSCRIGNEEALAGEHAARLFLIVDEASGVSDKAFSVMTGALTETDNRMLLLSQPTRPSGYFYRTHHELAKPKGDWTPIVLNSEHSPFVSIKFIISKRLEYGGTESPEYLIKVKGEFPTTVAGMLLSYTALEKASRVDVDLPDEWGWVATCDVGNGRDRSIINICKVGGDRMQRVVKNERVLEQPSTVDPVRFADIIHAECSEDLYPNITLVVDSDGVGYDTATCLERTYNRRVQRIHWGLKMFTSADKKRFVNKRAFANIMARDAVNQGRMKIDRSTKTKDQASKIPCGITETGAWAMMPKKEMKEKLNIPSPDRWDTYCFTQLADYIPHEEIITQEMLEQHEEVGNWVLEGTDV